MPKVTSIPLDALEPFVAFARECYRAGNPLSDERFIRWQFASPWDETSPLYVLQSRDGKVLAHNAGVRLPFVLGERAGDGCISMSLMSRPEVRGFGLGIGLVKHVQESAEVTLALAMTEDSLALHRRLGFHSLGFLKRFIFIVSPAVKPLLPDGQSIAPFTVRDADTGLETAEVYDEAFDASFTTLFDAFASGRLGVRRCAAYLNWRYREMPYYAYEALVSRNETGSPNALLVWRRDKTEPSGAVAGRIVELFGDPTACTRLARALIARARDEKLAYLDAFFAAGNDGRPLLSSGFVEASGEYARLLTHWTHPAEHSDNPLAYHINAAVYVRDAELAAAAYDPSNWYITKSDSDQDRPARI